MAKIAECAGRIDRSRMCRACGRACRPACATGGAGFLGSLCRCGSCRCCNLAGDASPAAVRLRTYLDSVRPALDQPSPPLEIKFWIDGDGVVTRVAFEAFSQPAPGDDLRMLLVGRQLSIRPPADMPLRCGSLFSWNPPSGSWSRNAPRFYRTRASWRRRFTSRTIQTPARFSTRPSVRSREISR